MLDLCNGSSILYLSDRETQTQTRRLRKLDFQDRTEKGKHQPNFYELSRKLIFKMRE